MKKINLILIIFGIVACIPLLYLLLNFQAVEIQTDNSERVEAPKPISQEEISSNYQKEIWPIFIEASFLASSTARENFNELDTLAESITDSLIKIKLRAMDLRVPENKRDAHLSFVMIIDDLKKSLLDNNQETYQKNYQSLLDLREDIL
ncbi:MAG: hypothetical protein U9Q85_01750 [Patescibacteria group bacterium]|nr:hypothetical protein [Patescibacteria group bacterium]